MRLFAAVLPPPDVSEELASAVGELRKLPGAEALRWTERPGWHFTLGFYGEVAEETAPELAERLGRAAGRTEPFPLALRGGGAFGGRSLWAGARGEVRTMALLAERAHAAGRRVGLDMEESRRYRPHLTLARTGRQSVDLRPYVAALERFESRTWTVGELSLVRSHLPRSGIAGEQPRYETVVSCPLRAAV